MINNYAELNLDILIHFCNTGVLLDPIVNDPYSDMDQHTLRFNVLAKQMLLGDYCAQQGFIDTSTSRCKDDDGWYIVYEDIVDSEGKHKVGWIGNDIFMHGINEANKHYEQ